MLKRAILAAISAAVLPLATAGAHEFQSQPHEWKNAQIVGGGFVSGIVFHPTAKGVAYARTDMGGGYRFDPTNGHWIPLTDFFKDYVEMGIETIAVDRRNPDRVYFASGTATADWAPKATLLRSDNRGDTWERFTLPFKCGANNDGRGIGERLAVDPNQGDILFFGTRNDGLWKSTDRGATWNKVTSFPVPDVIAKGAGIGIITFDPGSGKEGQPTQTIYAAVCAPNTPGLWRSTDAGVTWSAIPGQPEKLLPHHTYLTPTGTMYITYSDAIGPNGAGNGAVMKLDTASGEWTDITPEKPGANGKPNFGYAGLGVDASNPDTLVVSSLCRWAGGDELWRSIDGGKTWKSIGKAAKRDNSAAPYVGQHDVGHWIGDVDIDPFNPGHLLYVTGSGIWGSRDVNAFDKGEVGTFYVGAVGLEEVAVLDLISPPVGAQVISGMRDLGGFRHDDLTVSPQSGEFKNPRVKQVDSLDYAELKPELIVRAGTRAWSNQGAYAAFSSDGGTTWTPMADPNPSKPDAHSIGISADGSSIVMVPAQLPAQVSRDNGASWKPAAGLPDKMQSVWADRVSPGVFYAFAQNDTTLYSSTDGGSGFTKAGNAPGSGKLKAVPGKAGHLWLPVSGKGLFFSSDGGKSFQQMGSFVHAETVGFGKAADGSDYPAVFMTGSIGKTYGVFRSDDAGKSWIRINDDAHHFGNLCFAITGDPRRHGRVYIATNGRGVIYGDPKP